MKENHNIEIEFFKDGNVAITNLPNNIKSSKYTFLSINDDQYNRDQGEKNLKIKVTYNNLNAEKILKLHWDEYTITPQYITDQSNNTIIRIINEPRIRENGYKVTYYNYNTKNDIDNDYKGDMNVDRILPICFSGLEQITQWTIEEGVKEIL